MIRMPDIKISEEEFIEILSNYHYHRHGSEGVILKGKDKRKVRKLFFYNTMAVNENKLQKVKKLYKYKEFDNDVKVCATISCNKKFVGYDMISSHLHLDYAVSPLYYEDKIVYLKKVREKLEYFHSLDIVYGDVRKNNILLNTEHRKISFCDLDNMQVENLPIDLFYDTAFDFQDKKGLVNPTADTYMFNLLCLQELTYPDLPYNAIIGKLHQEFPKNLSGKGESSIHEMKKTKRNYAGGYLIDYFKK